MGQKLKLSQRDEAVRSASISSLCGVRGGWSVSARSGHYRMALKRYGGKSPQLQHDM